MILLYRAVSFYERDEGKHQHQAQYSVVVVLRCNLQQ
jgi:hypothetical protein